MPGSKWTQYDPPEKMVITRPDSTSLQAEILWRQRFATNQTVLFQIRASIVDEQDSALFFVTATALSPSDPEAIAAIRRRVTELVNTNAWTRDETYAVNGD